MENKFQQRIGILNTNHGGEYHGDDFIKHLKSRGTKQKLSVHDIHQEAGISECQNHTIAEQICTLLHASGLPKYLWSKAAHHAVWLLNQTTTKAIKEMTLYKAAFSKKPNLKNVREWDERVWVCVEKENKLGGHVLEGQWLGIDDKSKGICVLPESPPTTKTIPVPAPDPEPRGKHAQKPSQCVQDILEGLAASPKVAQGV